MSFLKQLISPFIAFDEDEKKQQEKEKKVVEINTSPANTTNHPKPDSSPPVDTNVQHPLINGPADVAAPPAQVPAYSPSGTLTGPLPEHVQYFEKLIDDANTKDPLFQGTDFKEFVDSKLDIDDIQDDAIKYKTAFNVLKSTGLTKEKLFSTGQEYLNLVGRDMNAFQGAHRQKYQKDVGQKEQLVQKKAEELQALTQKINALKSEINKLTQEIDVTKQNLDTIKNSYLLAGENKQKEIQTELEKIAQFF
jgi:hypothetical protein